MQSKSLQDGSQKNSRTQHWKLALRFLDTRVQRLATREITVHQEVMSRLNAQLAHLELATMVETSVTAVNAQEELIAQQQESPYL